MSLRSHSFEFHLAAAPPGHLRSGRRGVEEHQVQEARALWERQLQAARLGVDRVLAARALADLPELPRGGPGRALEATRSGRARRRGRGSRQNPAAGPLDACSRRARRKPRVRRAVAAAWVTSWSPTHRQPTCSELLEAWVSGGMRSCFVEAAAALALGPHPLAPRGRVLQGCSRRNAFQDVIRARAIEGLAPPQMSGSAWSKRPSLRRLIYAAVRRWPRSPVWPREPCIVRRAANASRAAC